jgi:dehydrogenase/reductase SDR family protein 4
MSAWLIRKAKNIWEDKMDNNKYSLKGKVAIVTGGSRGIGHASAIAFAAAGADVVVTSRILSDLVEVAKEIEAKGRKGLAIACDVGRKEDLTNLVKCVKTEMGRIDILMNNAGTNPYKGPLIDADEAAWDETMNVNLKGPFLLGQQVARIMKEQGSGNIINTTSVAGIRNRPGALYGISKAGLIMLTNAMAKEWGQFNIRVNSIAPGGIKTKLNEHLWKDPARAEAIAQTVALCRWGTPDDIAQTALFLASDASCHLTGQTIVVDGGEMVGSSPFPRK